MIQQQTTSGGNYYATLLRQELSDQHKPRGATLLDTGPLVAWFDRTDQDHERGWLELP